MDRNEFMALVRQYQAQCPQWRYGQTVFNVAFAFFPDETNKFRGSGVDPFYRDGRVDEFLDALGIV